MPEPHNRQFPLPTVLLCSDEDDSVLAMQAAVFRGHGYEVTTSAGKTGIQAQLAGAPFDLLVLNHSLSFADRKSLARKAKKLRPRSGVLVLHHSCSLGNPWADLAVDSRLGANAILRALERLQGMMHARNHYQDGFGGDYFVVADANRNYIFVSDGACELLGYDRANLLELRIDNIVAGATPVTDPLFRKFVADREQEGTITLRHRSGKLIPVKYWSKVEPDGCMMARWEPLANSAAG